MSTDIPAAPTKWVPILWRATTEIQMALIPTLRVLPTYRVKVFTDLSSQRKEGNPICPSGKDDAQILNVSGTLLSNLVVLVFFALNYPIIATDTKSGDPHGSTYPTSDPPPQECISP